MRVFLLSMCLLLLSACGFHLQGPLVLAPPLRVLYLQTEDPYGTLSKNIKNYLVMSNVILVENPSEATAILRIMRDDVKQALLGVNGTLQTRQYALTTTVVFEVKDPKGKVLVPPQTLAESRAITVQSNQVLGSSNEATLFAQQMRRTLTYAMMNRLASKTITQMIMSATKPT